MAQILLIDDEKSIRITLSTFLVKAGYSVITAQAVDEASKLMKSHDFDVIITDIILPRVSGVNLLKSIRNHSPHIQVILMTGEPEVETSIEAVRAGAYDYLVKPITKEMIIKTVGNAAKIKAVDDERRRLEKENKQYQEHLEKLVEERTKSLRESEERYSNIVAGLLVGVAIHVDHQIVFVNNSLENLLGYKTEKDFLGRNVLEFVHSDDQKMVTHEIQNALTGIDTSRREIPFTIEERLIKADGAVITVEASTIEINYYGKSALMVMINDITEKTHMADKLSVSDLRYRKSQEIGHVGNWEYNLQTTHFWGSDEAKRIYGFDPDSKDFTAEEVESCIPERERVHQALIDLIENDKPYNLEFEIITRDKGIRKTIISIAEVERDNTDNPLKISGVILDITNRKETEKEFIKSEEKFRLLAENSIDCIWKLDKKLRFTYLSPSVESLFGFKPEEWIGTSLKSHFKAKTFFKVATKTADAIKNYKTFKAITFETKMLSKKNEEIDVEISGNVLLDSSGKLLGLQGSTKVITERKKAEAKIIESESHWRTLVNTIPDLVWLKDPEGVYLACNSKFERLFGARENEIIGKTDYDFLEKDLAEFFRQKDKEASDAGKATINEEEVTYADDGHKELLETIKSPMYDSNNHLIGVLGVARDITLRKQTESEIKKLSTGIEQSPVSIVISDIDGIIEYVNPKFCELTGYTAEEAKGKKTSVLKSGQHTDSFYKELWDTILSGKSWRGEFNNKKKNGELFWEDATIGPIFDEEGKITHFVAIKEDITERIILQEQFQQAQKMESVARLAGGVAHDFNNMLSVILGYSEMALSELEPGDELYNDLKQINNAGQRSSDLTAQLLAFSRKQTIVPKVLDLNDCISGMLKMLSRLIGEDIDLSWNPGKDIWRVKMDPSQVDQVLANLCINARDAISGVGRITIKTENISFDKEYSSLHNFAEQGDYIMVSVYDTGCGMDKDTLQNIFEPFFTTKEQGEGTGLGLATVYGAVKQNHGLINVYSEPGQGTNFKLYFPRFTGIVPRKTDEEEMDVPKGNKEVIVLVEDEETILKMTESMLESLNYTVVSVNAPGEVLALVAKYDVKIDLLLTDVVMPKMNGKELATELKILHADMKVLFMSGYTSDIITNRGVLDEGVNFISKPFSKRDIAIKLKEVLT